jgi:hypothetical protein
VKEHADIVRRQPTATHFNEGTHHVPHLHSQIATFKSTHLAVQEGSSSHCDGDQLRLLEIPAASSLMMQDISKRETKRVDERKSAGRDIKMINSPIRGALLRALMPSDKGDLTYVSPVVLQNAEKSCEPQS